MNTGMYRVYDTEEKRWITDKCVLSPDGSLYKIEKRKFGAVRLEQIHTSLSSTLSKESRYVVHRCIYILDKKENMIFEGDILRSKSGLMGMVFYSVEMASYVLIVPKENKYYPLGAEVCGQLKIIGNTIDDEELMNM